MTVVMDTSAFLEFGRSGDKRLAPWFTAEQQILMPLIVVGELRAGFALGTKRQQNEALLQKFLDSPNVRTITVTDVTTQLFAVVFQRLKRAGTPINTNDMWIAALTLEHDCSLVTLDSDFGRVPDLSVAELSNG